LADFSDYYLFMPILQIAEFVETNILGGHIPYVTERATYFDRVGFLWGLWFPPTYNTNRPPNIVYRANNVHGLTLGSRFKIEGGGYQSSL
jgi:hypothetical protein